MFWFVALILAGLCESFSPMFGYNTRPRFVSAKMQRNTAQPWAPTVPKVVDLSQGSIVTDRGVEKSEFENFFAKSEESKYHGFMWELIDNNVLIYDMADSTHESAVGAFNDVFSDLCVRGGCDGFIKNTGSMELINPDSPEDSNWQPDCSFLPINRLGPMGSNDKKCRYPTLVVEIASSETNDHVISKARKYLGPHTTIQIVVVFLIRPDEVIPADRLQVLKFERGQQNPWACSLADPFCTKAGGPAFKLQLPVGLLFNSATLPPGLLVNSELVLDLYLWKKQHFLS
jgi:Uma2 family endonuclease